jgi:hypothetical protein
MRNWLIVGAGSTLKYYIKQIKSFVLANNCTTLGINDIADYICPDYHLFTNKKRFDSTMKKPSGSKLLLGSNFAYDITIKRCYDIVQDNTQLYRTAGCLAIKYAHGQGADNIYVAGMDGYSLKHMGDQHCWGSGCTDSSDEEYELQKDLIIYDCLRKLKDSGVDFRIITPTMYTEFYYPAIL